LQRPSPTSHAATSPFSQPVYKTSLPASHMSDFAATDFPLQI
jgi:hypothetical protein